MFSSEFCEIFKNTFLAEKAWLPLIFQNSYFQEHFSGIRNSLTLSLQENFRCSIRILTSLGNLTGTEYTHIPVDTGRKLNVLRTFNLCPVSTGMRRAIDPFSKNIHRLSTKKPLFWRFKLFL